MDNFFDNAPGIIQEAAKSSLGIFALMILILAVLGVLFFHKSSEKTRIMIFVLIFIGVASFGGAMFFAVAPTQIPLSSAPIAIKPSPDDSKDTIVSDEKLKNMGDETLARKQAELENRLNEMIAKQGEENQTQRNKREGSNKYAAISPSKQYVNVTGTWLSNDGLSYILTQSGNRVTIREINPLYGVTTAGQGVINRNDIKVSYSTALGTMGEASLKVDEDGESMSGAFNDLTTGAFGQVYLFRQR